jgi:hypothetical protein
MRKIHKTISLKEINDRFREEVVPPPIEPNWDDLRASEALFGFAAWLTTLQGTVVAGETHDASVWAKLVGEFCEVNGLEDPRVDFPAYFEMPASDFLIESKVLEILDDYLTENVERKLIEILDDPLPFYIKKQSSNLFLAEFDIDDITYLFAAEKGHNNWDVAFTIDDESLRKRGIPVSKRYDALGTGNAFSVFATIGAILEKWVKEYDPQVFNFTASGLSRVKLYGIFARKIADKLNYTLLGLAVAPNLASYQFIRNP